jgi:hypothetical protein
MRMSQHVALSIPLLVLVPVVAAQHMLVKKMHSLHQGSEA